jgi:hypothetical protein
VLTPIRLSAVDVPNFGGAQLLARGGAPLPQPQRPFLVATLRMGYGHYRIARAAVTWAPALDATALIHDPFFIDALESSVLTAGERMYGACSRVSAMLGGAAERAWGRVLTSGGASTRELSRWAMRQLQRLSGDTPRDWPVLGVHPWNTHLAVESGFSRVVNLVPDSAPQHFMVVPEVLNLTQNERSRQALLELGVPPERAQVAGHWVPAELASNAAADTALRRARREKGAPVRALVSMGGAGAQVEYYEALIARAASLARDGKLRLLVNAGDHGAAAHRLSRALAAAGLRVQIVATEEALVRFLDAYPLDGAEPEAEAVLVETPGPLEAVAATDRLIRRADVLVTKPSELAFFPVPKLHVRRVGDHEAASAIYSSELGDGSAEQREPQEAAALLERWCTDPEALVRLGDAVAAASAKGVYDGAKAALVRALGGTA